MHNKQGLRVGLGASGYWDCPPSSKKGELLFVLITSLLVFAFALLGILTRPMGLHAAFWPANAVLLGLLICNLKCRSLFVWVGAFIAYVFADHITGGRPLIIFWMTLANMGGAATGYCLYRRLADQDRLLGRPLSVLILFCVCAISAFVAAVVGAGSAHILFDQDFSSGFEFWFTGELVNYLAILPVILTFAGRKSEPAIAAKKHNANQSLAWRVAPLAALIASLIMGAAYGGPGAISFAVPALLWCALSYSMFHTSLCILGFCTWMLIDNASGFMGVPMAGIMGVPTADDVLKYTSSARLGIALVSIAPLAAAAINMSRLSLVAQLVQMAHYDFLTGTLARGEFIKLSSGVLQRSAYAGLPVAVLMLDIDRFKQINDIHGHGTGDKALFVFAETVKSTLRADDVFGRIGGEEFGLVIPGQTSEQAFAAADRIRRIVAERCASLIGDIDEVTVSIGVTSTDRHPGENIEDLLRIADQALYKAKHDGRDRVVQS